jgi:hypothetical protein
VKVDDLIHTSRISGILEPEGSQQSRNQNPVGEEYAVPNIELTAVFYLTIPDDVDADDVTIEVSEDGVITFAANDEEIASGKDVEGYETLEVETENDEDYTDEDEEDE